MKTKNLAVFAVLAGLMLGLIPQSLARAVTMSPVRIELAADPGKETTGIIKVYNDDTVARTFYLTAAKFENKDESGEPLFVEGKDGIVSWISMQPTVAVPSKESREITFTVNVPVGADPGGYYAAIFASVLPPDPGAGDVALRSDVGTLVLFRVNGLFEEGETILEFNTKDKKKIFNHLPIEFYYRFQNDGKDRALPVGDITIRNTFGGLTKIIAANQGKGNALPESVRKYEVAWITAGGEDVETNYEKAVYPEFKNFGEAVKYQWDNFALGRYSADLQVTVNNDSSRSYAQSTSFWVIPWQLLVVILAVIVLFLLSLLLLLFVIYMYWKRSRRRDYQR
ncbi:hypothetical protein IPM19_00025 [bacterium]|nr:MAG: hypothetical protein IPM19_00025 [bacterium]